MGLEVLINSFFKDFSRIAFSVHITATVLETGVKCINEINAVLKPCGVSFRQLNST